MTPEEAARSYFILLESENIKNIFLENSTTVSLDIRELNLELKDVCFLTYRFFNQDSRKPFLDIELTFYDKNREPMKPQDLESKYFYIHNPGNVLVKYL
tara:strand:- start:1092 stop:1388 length:297 start_codon:yes stop_codon:yes gene_type:complete